MPTDAELLQAIQTEVNADATKGAEATPSPEEGTRAEAPAAATPAATPSPVSLKDDDLVELQVGGKPVHLSWKDARTQMMLHADYTRKTTEAAQQRREAEALRQSVDQRAQELEAARQQLAGMIRDPDRLAVMLQAALVQRQQQGQAQGQPYGVPGQPQPFDPTQFAGAVQQYVNQQLSAFQQAQQVQQVAQGLENDLGAHLTGILSKSPALAALPGIDDLVFSRVEQMGPSTVEEAKNYAQAVVASMQEKLDGFLAQDKKQAALSKDKAIRGIEPKGGVGVTPTARKYKGGLDDPDLEKDAIAFVQSLQEGA